MRNQNEKPILVKNPGIDDVLSLRNFYRLEAKRIIDGKNIVKGDDFTRVQNLSKKIDELDIWLEKYHEDHFFIEGFTGHGGEYD